MDRDIHTFITIFIAVLLFSVIIPKVRGYIKKKKEQRENEQQNVYFFRKKLTTRDLDPQDREDYESKQRILDNIRGIGIGENERRDRETRLKQKKLNEQRERGQEPKRDKPNRYISRSVRREVWRRDQGKCINCGSREKLEYDHIIPVSKGGSSTARNVELLCEECNKKKSNKIE